FAGQRPVRPLPPNHDDHSGSRFGVDGRQMAAYRPTASTAGTGSVAKGIVASALVAKDFILFAGGGRTRARAAHDQSARHGQAVASARVVVRVGAQRVSRHAVWYLGDIYFDRKPDSHPVADLDLQRAYDSSG